MEAFAQKYTAHVRSAEHFLWSERYRPKKVEDCILPDDLKFTFLKFQEQGNIPNLLLSGGSGCGKTTVARALLETLNCDYLMINGSLKGNIDTLRNDIQSFASSMSFKGTRKYVILDEADYLTHATQPALRNFMEEFSRNCGFILTANYRNKIIAALQSRCSIIEFDLLKSEKLKLKFLKHIKSILQKENIEFDPNAIIALIAEYFPDCRRILNELQRYSVKGKIDIGILNNFQSVTINNLITQIRSKNYTNVRRWTTENLNNDESSIYRTFYDEASNLFKPSYIPELVLTLAKYQHQAAFSLDPEINFSACMAEIMVSAEWK